MKLVALKEFETWLAETGIVPDPSSEGQQLVFKDVPSELWRTWETPQPSCDLQGFVNSLMSAAAPAGPFVLRPRGSAPWYTGVGFNEGPLSDQLRDRIVATLPIPKDHDGAIECGEADWRDVQMLMLIFLVYGWSISGDLEVISGDRSCVMMTSHHGYVAVHCANTERLAKFEAAMLMSGFRAAGADDDSVGSAG